VLGCGKHMRKVKTDQGQVVEQKGYFYLKRMVKLWTGAGFKTQPSAAERPRGVCCYGKLSDGKS